MSRSLRVGRISLLVAVTALAGCGGEGEADGSEEAANIPEGLYGQAPAADRGIRSIVLLWPASPDQEIGVVREEPLIDQFGLVFSPERLVVDPGRPMRFANSESALSHNVQLWPMGATVPILDSDALPGDVIKYTLEPGAYDVLCDEHPGMRAFVFATDAPRAVFADEDGAFAFGPIVPGRYSIGTWTAADGFGARQEIEVAPGRTGIDLRPSAGATPE